MAIQHSQKLQRKAILQLLKFSWMRALTLRQKTRYPTNVEFMRGESRDALDLPGLKWMFFYPPEYSPDFPVFICCFLVNLHIVVVVACSL